MNKTIIFDLGGVVVKETPNLWQNILEEAVKETALNPEILYQELENHKQAIQKGEITLEGFYQKIIRQGQHPLRKSELLQKTIEAYEKFSGEYDQNILQYVAHLRTQYQVVCFTNTEHEIAAVNRKKGLFDHFEQAFISSDMGTRKPDVISYKQVLQTLNRKPKEAIFIDNDTSYIAGAEKAGIPSILFTSLEKLKEELPRYLHQ